MTLIARMYPRGRSRYCADVTVIAHAWREGQPVATRASFGAWGAVSAHYPARLDEAMAWARWAVGDYDCARCGQQIDWVPEPRRVYVHVETGDPGCSDGAGVADIARDERGWAVGPTPRTIPQWKREQG